MDKYLYEAHDLSGQIVNGMIEADSVESAEDVLKYNKLFAVNIRPYISIDQRVLNYFKSFFGGIKSKDKVIFARQLAIMINAGLPLLESLKELAKETTKRSMLLVTLQLVGYIEKGKTFSFALAQFPSVFSPIFVSMIKSGEMSGKLDDVLNGLALQMERSYSIKSKIKGALFYPGFIVVVMFGVSMFAIVYIIPKMEDVFTSVGQNLPILTRFLIWLSHFFINYWYLAIIGALIIIYLIRFFLSTENGKYFYAKAASVIPIIKDLNRGVYINDFAKNLALLMKGGVPIVNSLIMISDSFDNIIVREDMKRIVSDVERGIPLSSTMAESKTFPPLVISMMAVGEKTGQLVEVLENISRMYEEDTDTVLKGFTSIIEPLLMVIVGIAVGFLAVAVIMPMYQLSSAI